jgi:DNA-binding MurR/RpiR family transcriptional regulator
MELSELTQVFYTLLNKHLQREKALQKIRTSDPEKQSFENFLNQITSHFEQNFDRLDDKSLAFILSAQVQTRQTIGAILFKKLNVPTALRNLVLRVLNQ